MRGPLGHLPQLGHLIRSKEKPRIRPTLPSFWGSDPHEPALVFEDCEAVAMLGGSDSGRFWHEFLP